MHRIKTFRIYTPLLIAVTTALWSGQLNAAGKDWITLENCQLISNPDNDGDSFHVQANGNEYLVRLYLVDAPETKGGLMAARLIEQANYFGLSVPQVIEVGEKAKLFVDPKLSQPFTVVTRMAAGLGHSKIERFYGFVQTKDGDLGQLLVANGLARVHGTRAARPGASSGAEEIEKLLQLEQQAKQAKVGGWAQNVGATPNGPQATRTIALPQPSQTPPAKPAVVRATPPPPIGTRSIKPPPSIAADTDKLDINTATKEDLQKIPGIGAALSERIIAARPFRSADDLKNVQGIGNGKRYEQVRTYFK